MRIVLRRKKLDLSQVIQKNLQTVENRDVAYLPGHPDVPKVNLLLILLRED